MRQSKSQPFTGGTGAIVRINRALCVICQAKEYSNDDACTGILEILDNGTRYVPRKCRHELEMIEKHKAEGPPAWVHEMRLRREAKGGPVSVGAVVADVVRAGGIIDGATMEKGEAFEGEADGR